MARARGYVPRRMRKSRSAVNAVWEVKVMRNITMEEAVRLRKDFQHALRNGVIITNKDITIRKIR